MLKKIVRWRAALLFMATALSLLLSACGSSGGGGGSGGSNLLPPADFIVSGAVSAPGGAVAFLPPKNLFQRFADVFVSTVYAAIPGITPVADGTLVELVRINSAGSVNSVLATTTTSRGDYSFNFTKLGLTTASDLIVQVTNLATGAKMRAFVVSGTVNIDPASETAVRLVLGKSAASSLSNFTTQELFDIGAAVNLLAITKPLAAGFDIESTVTVFMNAIAADANITSFISSASGIGQTSQGPGDIGIYFPFDQGNTWVYQGTLVSNGASRPYTNTRQITGTKLVNGIVTTIFHETSLAGSGGGEDYLVKNDQAITNYGNNDITDTLTSLLAPYREYRFPLGINGSFESINKSGLSLPDTYFYGDGDGKPETLSVNATVTVVGFETIVVPAGTYENAARIESNIAISIIFSSDGSTETVTGTQTEWYAPGAGLVKSVNVLKTTFGGTTDTTTTTEELTTHVRQISLATNDLIYDPAHKMIYASVPSSAGSIGNSITLINPHSGVVGPSIPIGSEPGKLAISDNSQYLYVGLNGAAAVRRFDTATQTAGLQFSLGSDPTFGSFNVGDMDVLPGSPESVVISRKKGWSPGYGGVVIYDNDIMRPSTISLLSAISVIEYSALASRIYGYDNESSGFGLTRMSVNSTGVSVVDSTANLISRYGVDIKFDGGRLYATDGTVVDPEAKIKVGTFPLPEPYSNLVRPDSGSGRVYFLSPNLSGSVTIRSFNLQNFLLAGSVDIEGVKVAPPPAPGFAAGSLIRWGDKGLAFRTNENKVVLIKSALLP